MHNDILTIGGFTVHGYGLMIGIGFVLAMLLAEYRAKKRGMKEDSVIDIAILAGVFGFLGAKVLYVIVSFDEFMQSPLEVLGSSGFVVYGGIIGGVLASMIYCRIKKLPFLEYFDLVMPEIALAQGFGRIGCFLAGCCYGRETDAWYGVTFPHGSLAPAGVSLIPTQLISSAADFVNAFVLILIVNKCKNNLANGNIGALYMIFYGIGRFFIEFLRNDIRGSVGVLSTSQFISIFITVCGIGLFAICRVRSRKEAL